MLLSVQVFDGSGHLARQYSVHSSCFSLEAAKPIPPAWRARIWWAPGRLPRSPGAARDLVAYPTAWGSSARPPGRSRWGIGRCRYRACERGLSYKLGDEVYVYNTASRL